MVSFRKNQPNKMLLLIFFTNSWSAIRLISKTRVTVQRKRVYLINKVYI